jgi:Ni/Co efflux regulator RcnB
MKKLMALVLIASFTGAVIAQQSPATPAHPTQAHVEKNKKDKKKHHHHHREHKGAKKK